VGEIMASNEEILKGMLVEVVAENNEKLIEVMETKIKAAREANKQDNTKEKSCLDGLFD
jgi:hypothetical protein